MESLLEAALEIEQEKVSPREIESMLQVIQQGGERGALIDFVLTYLSQEIYSWPRGDRERVE